MIPGSAVVTDRKSAMSVFEKPRMSVRYLFVNCDDGPLNSARQEGHDAEEDEATPVAREHVARPTADDVGARCECGVARRLAELARDRGREEDRQRRRARTEYASPTRRDRRAAM